MDINNITNIIIDDFLYRLYLSKKCIYGDNKMYLGFYKNYMLEILNSIIDKINVYQIIKINTKFLNILDICKKYIEIINTTEIIELEKYYSYLCDIGFKLKIMYNNE
jgi:hypothetical protein